MEYLDRLVSECDSMETELMQTRDREKVLLAKYTRLQGLYDDLKLVHKEQRQAIRNSIIDAGSELNRFRDLLDAEAFDPESDPDSDAELALERG